MTVPAPSDLPQQIGPYRVLERLGAGGMGEVFLAYDERLDRRVAVKRIRPDAEVSADRRERFRREAKLAARLSHPAIVQVYDILHEGDFDYIVLEYVEGTSLWELIEDGPMDVHEVLDLARELADGLDAAHRQGIIHRDFKSENVLVAPSGRPKITDFGIAKQLLGSDESLTRANAVLGTYRVMSPEQARGEAVDHRTDLFALGVLLYEMLTGRSPFAAENSLATLNKVIHIQQKPVREINPAVPEGLSSLIDHLLQKDPALRPRGAGQVRRELDRLALATAGYGGTATIVEAPPPSPTAPVAGAAVPASGIPGRPSSALTVLRSRPRLVGAGLLFLLAVAAIYFVSRIPREPLYVAVLPSEVAAAGGSDGLDLLAAGVHAALLRGLVALEGISPKAAEEIAPVAGSPTQVARAVAADEVVSSQLVCRPEACRILLQRLQGSDGAVLWTGSFEVPTDDLYVVSNAVASQIQRGYPGQDVRPGNPELEVSGEDLRSFLEARQRFDARQEADLGTALEALAAIRGRSPRFLDAYLLEADIARHRFHHSRDPRDLEHALDLVQRARELAPDNPQPLLGLAYLAMDRQDLELAGQTLEELERLIPGDVVLLDRRALLLRKQGRIEEGIEILRTAVRRRPSWKRLVTLARMEQQHGEIAEARRHLELALERSPVNYDALSLLAQIELANGSPERAVKLYEELVRQSPGPTELSNLGLAYFLMARYPKAAESFRRFVEREPRNPLGLLNLADAYFLMGRKEEAKALYSRVVELAEADPSASSPQFLTVKAQALAHLGEGLRAVAAAQEASRLAPDDAGVAYETSLVYAVLGEDSSALVNAGKALELGYEPRWFTFPWFDSLRSHPDFIRLLGSRSEPR